MKHLDLLTFRPPNRITWHATRSTLIELRQQRVGQVKLSTKKAFTRADIRDDEEFAFVKLQSRCLPRIRP